MADTRTKPALMPPAAPKATAYSYIRFSTPDQAKGDSLRRQIEKAGDWCRRNNATLDSSTNLRDLGISAFTGEHRTNPDRYALAAFLKLVEAGKVAPGSFFVVESLDRLTREHIRPALTLLLNLIDKGVRVVQLAPVEAVYDKAIEPMQLVIAIMELSRGNSESQVKSERVGAAWAEKKKRARESGELMTKMLPAWIKLRDNVPVLSPRRAAVVKRIYALSANGYGLTAIVKKLTTDKVPAFAALEHYDVKQVDPHTSTLKTVTRRRAVKGERFGAGHWSRTYVAMILNDRRALGEFQPRKRDGRDDGAPIINYFPPAVTEAEWLAARAGLAQRKLAKFHGRTNATYLNIFAGLLTNARDGESYIVTTRTDHKPRVNGRTERVTVKHRVLVNIAAAEGRAKVYSFPFPPFETAVLSCLREIDPRELSDGDESGGVDEVAVLSGELAGAETELAGAAAYMDSHGFSPTIAARIGKLETRKRELAGLIADARQRAANPADESWAEACTLMGVLEAAPDPDAARLRLRHLLRRCIESIHLLGPVWLML